MWVVLITLLALKKPFSKRGALGNSNFGIISVFFSKGIWEFLPSLVCGLEKVI